MYKYAFLAGILLFLFFFTVSPQPTVASDPDSHNFTISLTLPGLENRVFVPGLGSVPATRFGTWFFPSHYYITSERDMALYGLVFFYRDPVSIAMRSTYHNHTLSMTLGTEKSRMFLLFTEGDPLLIENRIWLLDSLSFLTYPSPSFAYGLGLYHTVYILIPNHHLGINRDFSIDLGTQKLTIEHDEATGKAVIHPQ